MDPTRVDIGITNLAGPITGLRTARYSLCGW